MSLAELPEAADPITPDDMLYEIVDGLIVEKNVGVRELWIASLLGQIMGTHARALGLGRVLVEGFFRTIPGARRMRRPDVAFLSAERWPLDLEPPEGEAFEFAPDLAVEVVSPTDRAVDLDAKIDEYLAAGARQVWVVYRMTGKIVVFDSTGVARVYRRGDVLDGGEVVPGFRLAVSELLPEPPDGIEPAR